MGVGIKRPFNGGESWDLVRSADGDPWKEN